MKTTLLQEALLKGTYDAVLTHLYGASALDEQKGRYIALLQESLDQYGDQEIHLFSAPGRTEVGGNHTDHQLGRVFAASISLDVIAAVIPTSDNIVTYHAKGFAVKPVDVSDTQIHEDEKNTTEALIRGVAAGLKQRGFACGGFTCYADSRVLPGSGMSSSAAFEVLIATIMNHLYNNGKVSSTDLAKIGQYAENRYFMKASGLLDQMACSTGSFAYMDFADPENPIVEKVDFDPHAYGYDLILTDVRASHADLSDEYSMVPAEMKAAAKVLGKQVLGTCTKDEVIAECAAIREQCGDRAFLRAYHFVCETQRAKDEAEALKNRDIRTFLNLVNQSGASSWMYLQNISAPGDSKNQAIATALALSDSMLKHDGAYRVHGGGFAGTIQAFVPEGKTEQYISMMESVFGKGCCYVLSIRECGGIQVD
ncbi:MAG: galactokinase [Bulleidia sp.]